MTRRTSAGPSGISGSGSSSTSATHYGEGMMCLTSQSAGADPIVAASYTNLFGNVTGDGSLDCADEANWTDMSAVSPDYVDTTATDPADWDLTLDTGSGLIDAGDPSLLDTDGTTSDVGAHGGPNAGL